MLTQQDILDRLNQLTLRYNLTWYDIKYDADKAIHKINTFMGTKYPKMSEVLVSAKSSYAINQEGVLVPIFPEEYIHSVVIPFIAMEILARDEEFTTIYNKYSIELEQGLFHMFQQEFNRVPLVFRQNPDQGVFFASDSALGRVQRNSTKDLPVFKFRVYYHINNSDIVLHAGEQFVQDTRAYLYNDTAIVKGWNTAMISLYGHTAYHFVGWMRNPTEVTSEEIEEGNVLEIKSDIHLYAKWNKESTLNISDNGIVSIKNTYRRSLVNLEIPDYIQAKPVRIIPTNFIFNTEEPVSNFHATNLERIVLPSTLNEIQNSAFNGFRGTSIVFPTLPISSTYAGIAIGNSAFTSTPNLVNIVLPTNIHTIKQLAFPQVTGKVMNIYVRYLKNNKPIWFEDIDEGTYQGWHNQWADTDESLDYKVNIIWGYNG